MLFGYGVIYPVEFEGAAREGFRVGGVAAAEGVPLPGEDAPRVGDAGVEGKRNKI